MAPPLSSLMAPPLSWVLLDRVPRRTVDEDVVLRGYMSVQLAQPPRVSFVALPAPHLHPRDGDDFVSIYRRAHVDRGERSDHGDLKGFSHPGRGVTDDFISLDRAHGDRGERRDHPAHEDFSDPGRVVTGHADDDFINLNRALGDRGERSNHPEHGDLKGLSDPGRGVTGHAALNRARGERGPEHGDLKGLSDPGLAAADFPSDGKRELRLAGFPAGNSLVLAADRCAGLLLALAGNVTPQALARNDSCPDAKLYVLHGDGASTASVKEIPAPHGISGLGNVGLLSVPGRGGYVIVDVERITGTERARLNMFRSEDGGWVQKEVDFPAELIGRTWVGNGVMSHERKVWWTDLSRGIIGFDPYEHNPKLVFEAFPRDGSPNAVGATRCVNVSDGRIVYAEVRGGAGVAPSILVWSRSGVGRWQLEARAGSAHILAKETSTRVPDSLILVHPLVRSIVYCYADGFLVGLNLSTHAVVHMERAAPCCRALLAWVLPKYLTPGHYPRGGGVIALSGWQGQLWHVGPGQVLLSMQPLRSNTVFNLKLWYSEHKFTELYMDELIRGELRVSLRRSMTQPLMTRNLFFSAAVMMVPVPDFTCIMRAFAMVYEEVQGPRVPTASSLRQQIHRGSYAKGSWRVDMIERSAVDGGGAVLLLRFSSRYVKTFSAQIFPYPKFHRMNIAASCYAKDDGVVYLVAEPGSHEEVRDYVKAVRMVPLPCLSFVSESFP